MCESCRPTATPRSLQPLRQSSTLLRNPCSWQADNPISEFAAPQERSLSVTSTSGAKPCFLSSLRISFTAAALSRPRCTSKSRTSPSSSTARHSQNRRPAIITAISSICHCDVGRGRRRCNSRGEQWPEFHDPPSHRFVGHIEPTLSEQIFNVAIAERDRAHNGMDGCAGRPAGGMRCKIPWASG